MADMGIEKIKTSGVQRIPDYSRHHNVIPRLYVQEWQRDIPNRRHIIENAEMGGIPHNEHDTNLFLEKREQLVYNVEDRKRIDSKYQLPSRAKMLRPDFHHSTSKYQSSLMFRRDGREREYE